MSGANLLSPNNQFAGIQPLTRPVTGLSNIFQGQIYSDFVDVKGELALKQSELESATRSKIREKTGQQRLDDIIKIDKQGLIGTKEREELYKKATDDFIVESRKKDPTWNDVKTYEEIKAETETEIKKEALFTRGYVAEQVAGEGALGIATQFAGGVAGSFTDPINAATMFIGFGTAKSILQAVGREAALNAAIETVQIPKRLEWERKLGTEYGIGNAVLDVATAGVAGGVFTGLIRGGAKGVSAIQKRYFEKPEPVTMQVMDAIARAEGVPSEAKDAAKYISRTSHIDENNPVRGGDLQDEIQHRNNLIETETAFKEGRAPNVEIRGVPNVDPYLVRATDIKKQINARIIDINKPSEVESLIGYKPNSLAQFIKENGGIQDYSGELKARDIGKKSVGLIAKGKRKVATQRGVQEIDNTTDYVKQRAFDEGYFPDKNDYNEITDSELYDAIARDVNGEKVYKEADRYLIDEKAGASDLARQYDQVGITPDMTEADIASRLRELDDVNTDPAIDLMVTPKDNYTTLEEFSKIYDDPNYQAAIEADFARMLKEQPDMEIDIDGEIMTLSDFNDMLSDDDNILNAVRTCAIG